MKQELVVGTWKLLHFEIEDLEGTRRAWGQNTHGLLIYSESGFMSVSINKDIESSADGEFADTLDSILFYAGKYSVTENLIRHQVTEASNPIRVGKEMIRFATLDGQRLELVTPKESFGRAILIWERVTS